MGTSRRILGIVGALTAGMALLATPLTAQAAPVPGFTVTEVKLPGPEVAISSNVKIVGSYVYKVVPISTTNPKSKMPLHAPYVYDGQNVSKLANLFPSNQDQRVFDINAAGDIVGVGPVGPGWYYSASAKAVASEDPAGRAVMVALNDGGLAVGQPGSTFTYPSTLTQILPVGQDLVDVNNAGWMTGTTTGPSGGIGGSFVRDPGGAMITVPNPAGTICQVAAISEQAANGDVWVTGRCFATTSSGTGSVFRFEARTGTMQSLTGTGSLGITPVAVDSTGMTIANDTYYDPNRGITSRTAYAWKADPAAPIDLNAGNAFAPAGCPNPHVSDMNETTILAGCDGHTYLLT